MDQEELPKVAELGYGHVGRPSSLKTLDTTDTNPNVGGLDHRDVVGSVPDGQEQRLEMAFDKLDDQGFLKGRHTAAHISLALEMNEMGLTSKRQLDT